jgi:hypothetical protein
MDIDSMEDQARTVRQRFAEFEQRRHGRPWNLRKSCWASWAMSVTSRSWSKARPGVRFSEDLDRKVAHELADCLWAVLTLADMYGVDLEAAFSSTIAELHHWLDHIDEERDQPDPANC